MVNVWMCVPAVRLWTTLHCTIPYWLSCTACLRSRTMFSITLCFNRVCKDFKTQSFEIKTKTQSFQGLDQHQVYLVWFSRPRTKLRRWLSIRLAKILTSELEGCAKRAGVISCSGPPRAAIRMGRQTESDNGRNRGDTDNSKIGMMVAKWW